MQAAGLVTRFAVNTEFLQTYPVQTVDAAICQELWVPAEKLPQFNGKLRNRRKNCRG